MGRLDYTLVVGVDRGHLEQLALTWPTWRKNRSELLSRPMIVFFDREQLTVKDVRDVIDHSLLGVVPWPMYANAATPGVEGSKWTDPQRWRMLSGFVHVPAHYVTTRYWLKLDVDVVASESPCPLLEDRWFDDSPAIVAQRWGFTKPPEQMMMLDEWAASLNSASDTLRGTSPLNLRPNPGSSRLNHRRIISWCGVFSTNFTRRCAELAEAGGYRQSMPVCSQDGYMWYVATRLRQSVRRVDFKSRGLSHWGTMRNLRRMSGEVLG